MTTIKTFHFPSTAKGLDLAGIAVIPDIEFIGILQLVHGMAEHKERYLPFMKFMAEQGYVCILHDHQGHGESINDKDDLGYFYGRDAQFLIEDIHQLTRHIRQEYPELPLILFGHSMGSLLVRAYCKAYDEDIDALVVCGSPSKNHAAGLGKHIVRVMQVMKGDHYRSKLIQKMAFGSNNKAFQETHSENVWLCSDMDIVKQYDQDPLCGFIFTLNGFENLFSLMRKVYDKKGWSMKHKNLPILFVAGKKDPCIRSPKAFEQAYIFMKDRGYVNVKAHLFSNMRHEILNEREQEQVFAYVKEWLDSINISKKE